jgi:hypothetical protein
MEARHTATQKDIEAAAQFLLRMMPAMLNGVSFEEAGLAVLRRDQKLIEIATGETEEGSFIRKHLAQKVFDEINDINKQVFAERQAQSAKEKVIKGLLITECAALTKAGAA